MDPAKLLSLDKSISDHQLLAIKIVCQKLGVSTKQELEGKTLPQVYSKLAQVFPDDADSYMYLMLERVGLDEENLRTLFNPSALREVKIGFQEDTVLTAASIVDSMMINNEEEFRSFRKKVKNKFFPRYNLGNISTPEQLFTHLFDVAMEEEPKLEGLCSCFSGEYSTELENLAARHDKDITDYIPSMDQAGSDRSPGRRRCFWACILVTTDVLLISVLLFLFLISLALFIYFLIEPVSSGTTHHFLYAPPNTQVAALVDCFDSKTSEISVSTVSNNDFSLHKIQQDRLQVKPVQLQDKTITNNGFVTLYGHFSSSSNYYSGETPIYTAENGSITYEVQVKATPDNACPLKLFAFNRYLPYSDFVYNQPPFRNIDSYYNTSCLTGNQNHTVEISLKGNNYYFFGILYNETTIKITVSANTSQYSVDESDENCTTSANSNPCTFSASNFNDALKVHLGKPCLVSQTSDVIHKNITLAMKSQVGGVYSFTAMIVVFFFLLLAGMGSVVICVCCKCFHKK